MKFECLLDRHFIAITIIFICLFGKIYAFADNGTLRLGPGLPLSTPVYQSYPGGDNWSSFVVFGVLVAGVVIGISVYIIKIRKRK